MASADALELEQIACFGSAVLPQTSADLPEPADPLGLSCTLVLQNFGRRSLSGTHY